MTAALLDRMPASETRVDLSANQRKIKALSEIFADIELRKIPGVHEVEWSVQDGVVQGISYSAPVGQMSLKSVSVCDEFMASVLQSYGEALVVGWYGSVKAEVNIRPDGLAITAVTKKKNFRLNS